MKATASDVLQLVPETVAVPTRTHAIAALSGSALIIGAFGMAFSVLLFAGGPHFGYVLAGTAGFIGCAVLVASAVITMSIATHPKLSGTDAPAAVAYAVLGGGLITMLASAGYGATSIRMLGNDGAMSLISASGGFIAGAVLVAGGSIAAGFRIRSR